MMNPRESGQQYERPGASYEGGYNAGQQQYGQPAGQGPAFTGGNFDDNFAEVVADRLAQRMNSGQSGKVYGGNRLPSSNRATAGMRLALAIVSLALLIPIFAVLFGVAGLTFLSLVAVVVICAAIVCVNALFNFLA